MTDSVAKIAWQQVKARLDAISVANGYRSDLSVYVGRSSLHRLVDADESIFPAAIMQVGPWAREQDGTRRYNNALVIDVDVVVVGATQYERLFDALADITEAIESSSDVYLADPTTGRNLLRNEVRITDPTLAAPDAGARLESLSLGIALDFPTEYGRPAYVIP